MDIAQNMDLFRELVRCGSNIYTWCYDAEGSLVESNCPEEELLATAFSVLGCKDRMLAHWKEHSNPITIGTGMGLIWGAAFEQKEGQPYRAWILGPFFYTEVSVDSIRRNFLSSPIAEMSIAWRHRFVAELERIPSQPYMVHGRYLLMLHYCLTQEHLMMSDLGTTVVPALAEQESVLPEHDRHRVWAAEKALMRMVSNGDLDYKQVLSTSILLSSGVPIRSKDPLHQGKVSIIVFCTLVCRAAIEGGLSPEQAYALNDAYIQSLEDVHTAEELISLALTMYDDFIHRVRKLRTNPQLSVTVQKCIDYIEMHLSEKIRASDLAAVAGYSEYYLTRRFRDETGVSVSDYVKYAKIERAKVLLRSTEQSIQDIANTLGFSTRSHFSQSFRAVTGKSPVEFRAQEEY